MSKKRYFLLITCVIVSFCVFACGKADNNPISSIFVLAFVIMIIGIVLVTIDDLKK